MPDAVGIRFRPCGKIYDFEVNGIPIKKGDLVVVESDLGLSIGTVVIDRHETQGRELKKVIRLATDDDLRQKEENDKLSEEYRAFCLERIMARGLPMKLICAEATLDRKRIIFYFVSDGRVDFRELVKDLAARFRTRIEMRQIGVRDETKMIGGIGICGREVCCRTFLTTFEPVSIKMVKDQEIVLNTSKLSGLCGRLMCCLGYEYDETEEDSANCVEADSENQGSIEEGLISDDTWITEGQSNLPMYNESVEKEEYDSPSEEKRANEGNLRSDFRRRKRRRFHR
ncbi:MAG: stage 0 sporulation family protein [Thermodesulfovibrionales bacterium]